MAGMPAGEERTVPLESSSSPVTKYRDRRRLPAWASALVACCAVTIVAASAQAPRPSLKLVSTAWTPFTNEPGEPRFALDLVEAALDRIGRTARTTIVAPAAFTRELLTGAYDGSGAAWKDDERERVLLFSAPYLENRLVLVGRHESDVSATALSELAGKRVAIVEGYSYGDTVERAGPTFVRARSEEDCLARLLKGDVDYALMDDLVVQYIVNAYPTESAARLQVGSTAVVRRELYLAIRRSLPDAQAIVDGFSDQVRRMIADRTYHRLLHVDWIRADVNGDGVEENVPLTDKVGPTSPERVYRLFSKSEASSSPGFYVGGTVYSDWASVPESYREVNPDLPDARRSTASLFKFTW
jgi:polar amino acid transport system substrate-binding protein